jgi:hypothetical protein
MTENGAILPMFYLPPVEYFSQLNKHKSNIIIEKEENFIKQSYRNRTHVYSPDGILTLTVPVAKGAKVHTSVKDVKISYDFEWQRLHWLSLEACYRRSAYFEYYEDDLVVFYRQKYEYLFDYNEKLLNLMIRLLKIKTDLKYTEEYIPNYPDREDFRLSITPKKNTQINQKPYFQLFEERQGFLNNLSIIDLLFNQGPQAINYL